MAGKERVPLIYTPGSCLHSFVFVLLASEHINRSGLGLVVCSGKVVSEALKRTFFPAVLWIWLVSSQLVITKSWQPHTQAQCFLRFYCWCTSKPAHAQLSCRFSTWYSSATNVLPLWRLLYPSEITQSSLSYCQILPPLVLNLCCASKRLMLKLLFVGEAQDGTLGVTRHQSWWTKTTILPLFVW